MEDDELERGRDLLGFGPMVQRVPLVGTENPKEASLIGAPEFFEEVLSSAPRVAGIAAPDLVVRSFGPWESTDGEMDHSKTIGGGGPLSFSLEGRAVGGNEDDAIQLQFLTSPLREERVAEMNRIEAPPKQGDTLAVVVLHSRPQVRSGL